MQVQITSGIHWDGKHCEPGDVIDVKEWDANWLINRKKAKMYDATTPVVNRVVEAEASDQPKLTKRSWKKNTEA